MAAPFQVSGFRSQVSSGFRVLAETDWLARRTAHEQRVREWTDPHQARQARGEKHPVEDFLFEYYRFRPSWLRRWHPGPDVLLQGAAAREFLRWPEYREVEIVRDAEPSTGVMLDPSAFDPKRRDTLVWLAGLLRATAERPPQFACFGLHEWAMVYRQAPDEIRHGRWPLRFPPDELARIVEAQPIRCSHFDAFRFFTASARPLNRLQPERATVAQFEQRGCLHANMDLYKWAFKLAPFPPAEFIADCFALARDIREVDMRASPYDLRALGYAPIAIETMAGRAEYEAHQRAFAERSQSLRACLLALVERLLAAGPSTAGSRAGPLFDQPRAEAGEADGALPAGGAVGG
ncbi:MAG TPA: 3-methyladenine DNA glycosylase [Lacunisphaera sp.]|nr:3-methyladenine DNA glycosylase [Lacunisphaera sp.]